MIIRFRCPHCRAELEFDDLSQDTSPCPLCEQPVVLRLTEAMRRENQVDRCALCDCETVYVQKDFNRALGLGIFIGGAVISLVLYGFNQVWWAFGVLLVCAAADGLLYRVLSDVTICYKCHTQYRKVASRRENLPFELGLAEKFDPLDKRSEAENPAAEWHGR